MLSLLSNMIEIGSSGIVCTAVGVTAGATAFLPPPS